VRQPDRCTTRTNAERAAPDADASAVHFVVTPHSMQRKRSLLLRTPTALPQQKRHNSGATAASAPLSPSIDDLPSDTEAALLVLQASFPIAIGAAATAAAAAGSMEAAVPFPVFLFSQLYALVKDRTVVDREISDLARRRDDEAPAHGVPQLQVLKIAVEESDACVTFARDYTAHVSSRCRLRWQRMSLHLNCVLLRVCAAARSGGERLARGGFRAAPVRRRCVAVALRCRGLGRRHARRPRSQRGTSYHVGSGAAPAPVSPARRDSLRCVVV
jgi:hypothetical protein